ncbi:metalloenzyme domain protein [Deinococcus puniceus]|uniref:Metalloenzyme domain protein n=1 Tax=Deinococcus puniceus TaxID=1182568 RepID=A0A172T6J1_9DEIO|nr:metalloenzyme domain protein [Deinococcus puniceus]ANE42556.1 metalloenzyme domain protein [Deinococcus puniceus]
MPSALLWLALDGVGHPLDAVGPDSIWDQPLSTLRPLIDAGQALDTTLGVPGLPQSGTGQACWLTGIDAVRVMGEHFGPHPGPTLQRLLRESALPVRLAQVGARVALANHYPPPYFEAQARRPRMGCFPFSFLAAGSPLNPPGVPPVPATLGLSYAEPWPPVRPLDEMFRLGESLAASAQTHDLLAADLWFSDSLGHLGSLPTRPAVAAAARAYLARVDALLAGALQVGARVLLTSDHGNAENLTVKAHTLARVPFAAAGLQLPNAGNVVEAGRALAESFSLPPLTAKSHTDSQLGPTSP